MDKKKKKISVEEGHIHRTHRTHVNTTVNIYPMSMRERCAIPKRIARTHHPFPTHLSSVSLSPPLKL